MHRQLDVLLTRLPKTLANQMSAEEVEPMNGDTRGAYRFGPMPSWYAHRQVTHDHEHSVSPAGLTEAASGEPQRDGAGDQSPPSVSE